MGRLSEAREGAPHQRSPRDQRVLTQSSTGSSPLGSYAILVVLGAVDQFAAASSNEYTLPVNGSIVGSVLVAQIPRAPSPSPAGPWKGPTISHIPLSGSAITPPSR